MFAFLSLALFQFADGVFHSTRDAKGISLLAAKAGMNMNKAEPKHLPFVTNDLRMCGSFELPGRCNVCRLRGTGASTLYLMPKKDGLGAVWSSVVIGMALANWCGMNFGGMANGEHTSHGFDVGAAATNLFGIHNMAEVFPSDLPTMDRVFEAIYELNCPRNPIGERIMLDTDRPQEWMNVYFRDAPQLQGGFLNLLTPHFLDAFVDQVKPGMVERLIQYNAFQEGVTSVAMHIRRGDIDVDDPLRYTPDEWYFAVVEAIRKQLPLADFHVWSYGDESDFAGFKERGVTLHLKRDDVGEDNGTDHDSDELDAWAHFMSASVFVTAMSSFSWIPALLNQGCVIYGDLAMPLPDWYRIGISNTTIDEHELKLCLMRGLRKVGKDIDYESYYES